MAEEDKNKLKVIARLRTGRLVKGYLYPSKAVSMESIVSGEAALLPDPVELHLLDSDQTISMEIASLKALFFVKSFEGSKNYTEIKFFDKQPPIGGLWVRVQFHDHECLEGITQNTLQLLLDEGFFMKPPDPQSNNKVLYVIKSSLEDFRILGVKAKY